VEHAFKPKFGEKRDSAQHRLPKAPAMHVVNNAVNIGRNQQNENSTRHTERDFYDNKDPAEVVIDWEVVSRGRSVE
jgi:hypothetical protein